MSRRFQFSLRALLGVTAIIAGPCTWVAYNANIVRQREAMWLRIMSDDQDFLEVPNGGEITPNRPPRQLQLPWLRRALGDWPRALFFYRPAGDPDGSQLRQVRKLFPEAEIFGRSDRSDTLPPGMERWPKNRWLMF